MAAAAELEDLVRVEAQGRLVPDLFGSRRRRRRIAELEFDLRSRDLAQLGVGGFGGWSVLSGGFIHGTTFALAQTLDDIGAEVDGGKAEHLRRLRAELSLLAGP